MPCPHRAGQAEAQQPGASTPAWCKQRHVAGAEEQRSSLLLASAMRPSGSGPNSHVVGQCARDGNNCWEAAGEGLEQQHGWQLAQEHQLQQPQKRVATLVAEYCARERCHQRHCVSRPPSRSGLSLCVCASSTRLWKCLSQCAAWQRRRASTSEHIQWIGQFPCTRAIVAHM